LTDAAVGAAKTTMRAYHSTTRGSHSFHSINPQTRNNARRRGRRRRTLIILIPFQERAILRAISTALDLSLRLNEEEREIASAEVELGGRGRGVEEWRRDGTAVKIETEKCLR